MRNLADAFHALNRNVVVVAPYEPDASSHDAGLPYRVFRYRGTSRIKRALANAHACLRSPGEDYTISALWFPSGLAASLLPRAIRGKLGVFVHGSDILKPRGLGRLAMRSVLERADAVFTTGPYVRSLVADAGIRREVLVGYCGAEIFDVPVNRSPTPTILAVGRLIERKGFDRLLRAMPEIRRCNPRAVCEIIGDGSERERLGRLAEALGVSDAVRFLGSVDDEVLHQAYGRAWCFALPVRREGNDVEGFGLVYLEAAMAGLAAIGGRNTGANDAIVDGETGLLVNGADPLEIARAANFLLADREQAQALGQRGRARALQDFSWIATAKRIDRIMSEPDL